MLDKAKRLRRQKQLFMYTFRGLLLFKSRFANIIGGILVTLALGALGNGVWESLFKPILLWLRDVVLTIGTLGIQSLIDDIYVDVGKSNYERGSLVVLTFMLSMVICSSIFVIFVAFRIVRQRPLVYDRNTVDRIRSAKFFMRLALPITLISAAILIFRITSVIYAIEASANLERYELIIAPYLTTQEVLIFRSRIAQLHSRAEFLQIVSDMKSIVKLNNLYDPTISIF
jgi:hypothetical protein